METVIEAVEPVAAAHDMSMFALFMQADWVVKSVMLGLLFASIACWAVIFAKAAAYARAKREMKAFDRIFASGEPLNQIYARLKDGPRTGLGALFAAAMEEWNGSHAENAASSGGLQARLRIVLDTTVAAESEKLDRSLSLLATVGSAAPFVGLFGTVWGIVNALIRITASGDASIEVVAGPVGEALIMTAIGLAVAVPAVIFYNLLGRRNKVLSDAARHFAYDVDKLMASSAKA